MLAPVFVYKNNVLEDCSITAIMLYLRNQTSLSQAYTTLAADLYTRVEAQVSLLWCFLLVISLQHYGHKADIVCFLNTQPRVQLSLTSTTRDSLGTGDYIPKRVPLDLNAIRPDLLAKSGLILGEIIM